LVCSSCSSSLYVLLFHVHIFSFINFLYPILTLLPFSFFAFVSSRIHPYMPRSFLVKSFVIKIFLFSFSCKHDFFSIISIFFSYLLTCPTYIFLLILYTLSISTSISRLSEWLVRKVEEIYARTRNKVKVGEKEGEWFETTKGVRQGCPLSPLLFTIYVADVDEMLRKAQAGGGGS
jgi:hypothetical protein